MGSASNLFIVILPVVSIKEIVWFNRNHLVTMVKENHRWLYMWLLWSYYRPKLNIIVKARIMVKNSICICFRVKYLLFLNLNKC